MRRRGRGFGKYHARTSEQAAYIEHMIAEAPRCVWCRKPVMCGQLDGLDRPAHHLCQLALWRNRRWHDRAHPNPRLPQVQYEGQFDV